MHACELCDQQLLPGTAFACGLCGKSCCRDCVAVVPAPLLADHAAGLFVRPLTCSDGYLCVMCASTLADDQALTHPTAGA